MLRLVALCSCFLGLAIALGGGAAPALARDYVAVNALDDSVDYLDPTTVRTDGDIKTFWAYTVYIRTTNVGVDWTSEHRSVDCKNDRSVILDIIGYRMNGDVVADTENTPNIQHYWNDIPPETGAAAMEDAVCHGHDLGADSGSSFSEIVPIARRRLLQIAAKKAQSGQAAQQTSSPRRRALGTMLRVLGEAMQQASKPPVYPLNEGQPVYSSSSPETGQTVYSASECVGTIVAGVCHGAILPNQATHPVCHGEMLNGTCTGPMF